MSALKTETDTPEVGAQVLASFLASGEAGFHKEDEDERGSVPICLEAVFEHGCWWIACNCGARWSAHDAEGPTVVGGFCFEQVSEGDPDYHRCT